jgi:hypothetical protein
MFDLNYMYLSYMIANSLLILVNIEETAVGTTRIVDITCHDDPQTIVNVLVIHHLPPTTVRSVLGQP